MPSPLTTSVFANWKPSTMFCGTSFGTGVRAWRPTFVVADGATSLPACTPPLSGTAVHALASTTADAATTHQSRRTPLITREFLTSLITREFLTSLITREFLTSLIAAPHGGDAARAGASDNDTIGADRGFRLDQRLIDVGWLNLDRRLHHDRARAPRQGENELRAFAAFAPGLQPATVQSGIFRCDRQAKAGTAGRAGSGRVSPPEPVEHQR